MAVRHHITLDREVLPGKAFVRGTSHTVESVLRELSHGKSPDLIAAELSGLTPEDVTDCAAYGARILEDIREFALPDEDGLPLPVEPLDHTPAWAGRISVNPAVCVGKPVIRGTRLAVEFIIGLLASGLTREDVLRDYDHITDEDITACLAYARDTLHAARKNPLTA